MAAALALVFFYAPLDEDGLNQKIFYIHVPIAFAAYACFGWGGWKALRISGRATRAPTSRATSRSTRVSSSGCSRSSPARSGRGTAGVTGGSGARTSSCSSSCCSSSIAAYFMLRFSLPPGPQRANLSAVYALFGVVLVPVSVLAIRLSERFIHPVAFDKGGPNMAGSQFFTFCVAVVAMLTLAATLYHLELAGKRLDQRLRELREALQ